jgi:integrase
MRAERWILESLVKYARSRQHRGPLTVEFAIKWAKSSKSTPCNHSCRLNTASRFARFWQTHNPRVEVPIIGLLGPTFRRRPVHIYSHAQIQDLLKATSILGGPDSLQANNIKTLLGLLAVTGMRISEALSLRLKDVDWENNILTLFSSKSGESRLIPIHTSTSMALKRLRQVHNRLGVNESSAPLFLSTRKGPLTYSCVLSAFHRLRSHLGWTQEPVPRIHDLRHTFAVNKLLKWCQQGEPFGNRILSLSTYLGHREIAHTYWYFSAIPELLEWAAGQLKPQNFSIYE